MNQDTFGPNLPEQPVPTQSSSNMTWYIIAAAIIAALALLYVYSTQTPSVNTETPTATTQTPPTGETQTSSLTSGNTIADISADLNQIQDASAGINADMEASANDLQSL